jgi:hypothetical protein
MTNASPMKSRTSDDTLMLLRAVDEGDAERVKSLLAAGADANATSENNETALMRAVSKGHLEVVHVLLDAGGDVHAKSENGFTPLFMAVFFGYADIARALLARGSDPAAPTRVNTTAAQWARSWGSAEVVELLNDADAARAHGSTPESITTDGEQAGATPSFFPADGQFRAVVPLSEIGNPSSSETTPASKAIAAEIAPRGSDHIEAARPSTDERVDEQEETTLVPMRVSHATPSRPTPAIRHSWPVTAVALVLSVIAGLIAGSYLIGARQSVETQQRPAPQLSASESAAAPVAPVVTEVKPDAKAEKVKGDESVSKTAPPNAETKSRASEAEPPSRRVAIAEARLERPTQTSRENVDRAPAKKLAQRDTAAALPRAKPTQERSSTPAPTKQSLPVSSPPPSANAKKVIQWP